jgi:hypothetical protein
VLDGRKGDGYDALAAAQKQVLRGKADVVLPPWLGTFDWLVFAVCWLSEGQ